MDLNENNDLLAAMTECAENTASLPRPVFMDFSDEAVREANRRGQAFYRRRHPEAVRARRVNARGSGDKIRAQQIASMLERQKRRCWWCGKKIKGNDYHVDHVIPITRGGSNDIGNLCIACPSCNLRKGARSAGEAFGRLF